MKNTLLGGWVLLALLTMPVVSAQTPDVERGRELHHEKCRTCHDKRVYLRDDAIVKSYQDLRDQVDFWQSSAGLNWSAQDIEDVAFYLNELYYKFDCPQRRPDVC